MCREPAHLVLVNPDGSGERDLGDGTTPAWSPDGSRLAYTAGDARAIYVVDADGTNQRVVVRCDEPDCVSVMSPTWSPDASQIAFTAERTSRSGRDPEVDIWVVDADGADAHAVTACRRPDCSSNFAPAWSPVGDEIAMWSMVRCRDGWGPSLRVLDLSTGDIRDVVSCVGRTGPASPGRPMGAPWRLSRTPATGRATSSRSLRAGVRVPRSPPATARTAAGPTTPRGPRTVAGSCSR